MFVLIAIRGFLIREVQIIAFKIQGVNGSINIGLFGGGVLGSI